MIKKEYAKLSNHMKEKYTKTYWQIKRQLYKELNSNEEEQNPILNGTGKYPYHKCQVRI